MTPAALLLSSPQLLNNYLQAQWPTAAQLYHDTTLTLRQQLPNLPDYAIESRMHSAGLERPTSESNTHYVELLLSALAHLARPLQQRAKSLYVKQADFAQWQDMLSYVMPLPVIAFFAVSQRKSEQQALAFFKHNLHNYSCLPGPYIPELEHLYRQGVSEHHLHIMGTTESDFIWLDALQRPKAMLANLQKASNNTNATQQLAQLNRQFKFADIYRLLHIATGLRRLLLQQIQKETNANCEANLHSLMMTWPAPFYRPQLQHSGINSQNPLVHEAMLLFTHYQHVAKSRCAIAARTLHVYLLIQAMLHRLLNQQLLDKGFQQFEKVTQNELREATEEHFTQRFYQLHGMYNHPLALLEVRFAPKVNSRKLHWLLHSINQGYQNSPQQPPLSLTAHFIKQKDKPNDLHLCRHYNLRKTLEKQCDQLLDYLKNESALKANIVAVDAAGNELHAGPDVFSPLYRKLRKSGFNYFTYHAGEDFMHLLCGMRQVYEAACFLDLRAGDRIGHATAIGVAPQLWLDRAAPEHKVEQGQWLDTLLFTHYLLLQSKTPEAVSQAYLIETEIQPLAENIFDCDGLSIQALQAAWQNRWRDPLYADFTSGLSTTVAMLLQAWHNPDVYHRSRKLCIVKSNILTAQTYTQLQDAILKYLNEKGLALEVLPTSNLRISYYQNYEEHHIHRWINAKNTPTPAIIVGSDDPGIFSTSIFNEYAHIYLSSKNNSSGNSKAGDIVEQLMMNGKVYGFLPISND